MTEGSTVEAVNSLNKPPIPPKPYVPTPELIDLAWERFKDLRTGPLIRADESLDANSFRRVVITDALEATRGVLKGLAAKGDDHLLIGNAFGPAFTQALHAHPLMASLPQTASEKIVKAIQWQTGDVTKDFVSSLHAAQSESKGPPQSFKRPQSELIKALDNLRGEAFDEQDVQTAAHSLAKRFGLEAVCLSEHDVSCRQRMRWLSRIEKVLTESCDRLGIEETSFGRDGQTTLSISTSPEMGTADGQFTPVAWPKTRIDINPGCFDPAAVLTHEFAHQLDHDLGTMALRLHMEKLNQATPSAGSFAVYFSSLSRDVQLQLPQAEKALSRVFGLAAGAQDHSFRGLDANKVNGEGFANAQGPHGMAAVHLKERLDRLADRILIKVLGETAIMNLPDSKLAQIREALRGNDDIFLQTLGQHSSMYTPDQALGNALANSAPKEGSHPLLDALQNAGIDSGIDRLSWAMPQCQSALASVASMLHAATRGDKPSPLVEQSVREDVKLLSQGNKDPYISQEIELFARTIGRSKTVFGLLGEMSMPGWQTPLDRSRVQVLNSAVPELLTQAGYALNGRGTHLSMGLEKTIKATASASMAGSHLLSLMMRPKVKPFAPRARAQSASSPS